MEKLLHYIWSHKLYEATFVGEERVEVLYPGVPNDSDGPDFLEAKVQFDGYLWCGAIEIHSRASQWYHHRHASDPNYDGVVLHVVLDVDADTQSSSKGEIPTARMLVSPELINRLELLAQDLPLLKCAPDIGNLSKRGWREALDQLLGERLEEKMKELKQRSQTDDLRDIFYLTLLHYLGVLRNNHAMEQVAREVPYTYLKKHAYNLLSLEAMLIGQAGLLESPPRDQYEEQLLEEYRFLASKFSLAPPSNQLFKRLRVRPVAHPTRMLAIAAKLIQNEEALLSAILGGKREEVDQILATPPSEYWCSHYDFTHMMSRPSRHLGKRSRQNLIINAIIPTTYHYHLLRGDQVRKRETLEWLESLPREENHITTLFENSGLKCTSAKESQALIQLYKRYCTAQRCLECPLSPLILSPYRTPSNAPAPPLFPEKKKEEEEKRSSEKREPV